MILQTFYRSEGHKSIRLTIRHKRLKTNCTLESLNSSHFRHWITSRSPVGFDINQNESFLFTYHCIVTQRLLCPGCVLRPIHLPTLPHRFFVANNTPGCQHMRYQSGLPVSQSEASSIQISAELVSFIISTVLCWSSSPFTFPFPLLFAELPPFPTPPTANTEHTSDARRNHDRRRPGCCQGLAIASV